MFHVVSLIAVGVALVLYAGAGVLAITAGRALPWLEGQIVRPRLWGSGALLSCAGVALFRYGDTVRDLTLLDVVFGAGMVLFLTGAVMQFCGRRPGRTPV
ncbi:hypothetical protein ACFSL4_14415 [Streptomyces caeni]|uniref:Uncharacterized protein n=1 Tax=Streptomyces caeni TaxID=2307231 RepID=A0ABW4ITV7_9ACTN